MTTPIGTTLDEEKTTQYFHAEPINLFIGLAYGEI